MPQLLLDYHCGLLPDPSRKHTGFPVLPEQVIKHRFISSPKQSEQIEYFSGRIVPTQSKQLPQINSS